MKFVKHSNLEGRHAFLSPSSYHWVNYTPEKLDLRYRTYKAAQRGTELHDLAAQMIRMGVRAQTTKQTFNMYVNDAIRFRMDAEVALYYSDNCFGTADAISFRKNVLRIHDLKTGVAPTKMTQLEIYAALFCLEYRVRPAEVEMELRIYQNDEIVVHIPDPERIIHLMDRIVQSDKHVEALRSEVE